MVCHCLMKITHCMAKDQLKKIYVEVGDDKLENCCVHLFVMKEYLEHADLMYGDSNF